jgi:hypothetical protein
MLYLAIGGTVGAPVQNTKHGNEMMHNKAKKMHFNATKCKSRENMQTKKEFHPRISGGADDWLLVL